PSFRFPDAFDAGAVDGFLEVFEGSGANWSYVRPGGARPFGVVETAEKREISNLCCTGLYHFGRAGLFAAAYATQERLSAGELQGGELYVAPLYNELIRVGRDIRYALIRKDDVIFCGVPNEYEELLARPYQRR
ncbi:MAG: capsular biosynthesis protein, partial [Phyllobacteriaceae bacterium]|nr:capsular biosynthesis protein [Phyllobacteriaceae bacterium]